MIIKNKNFLLINKPEGWTSFDVVAFVRKQIKTKKLQANQLQADSKLRVGHAGTLDPFATGLLIVGVGREATKRLDEFKNMPKTYIATIKLGEISDTYDKTGEIQAVIPNPLRRGEESLSQPTNGQGSLVGASLTRDDKLIPTHKQIKKVVNSFKGKQMQIPPMFSAKKINGKKLYELARKGIEVERQPNEIEIYKIKILDYSWPFLKITVQCSAGTYIRSLADDIGKKLGTGAYCQDLTRTKIGKYSLNKARHISGQARDINGLTIPL